MFDEYLFEKNLQGDVVAIYNASGTKLVSYTYDAWGKVTTTYSNGGVSTGARYNPFRYRGYYYDEDTGLYYLNARYYDPCVGRFINVDGYLNTNGDIIGYNLFSYCGNNPTMRVDYFGYGWDVVLDIFFIGWDIYNLIFEEGYKNWEDWAALGIDTVFAVVPFLIGGEGKIMKIGDDVADLIDFKNVTVIGETMDRVIDTAMYMDNLDNLYDGFKSYKKLSDLGKGGKILAEIGGKASNIAWLYGKVRKGFTVVDIGIDIGRLTRSSSYIAERIFLAVWKYRNIWKLVGHIIFG